MGDTARPAEGPGSHVGRYRLMELIGEGGFGAVFLAEQERPVRRKVALKVIKLGMDTKEVVARFEAERQALALMDHPNIAKVFDGGTTDAGRPFFVMELVRGVPITAYCDERKLGTRERLALFAQVCRAVQHAHQKGVIHRDLKPSNVLVTSQDDGTPLPKVIDFGIAKAAGGRLTERTIYTEFRQFIGTPEYMSPEQAGLGGLDVDTRSDVYSLGVLLYELLTGTTPFDGRELRGQAYGEIQRIIREVEPPRPSTRVGTMAGETLGPVAARRATEPRKLGRLLHGELDWIVMRCLEKDRARRYDTANGLAADVERYLKGEPVSAGPPSAAYRLRKFVRRNRRLLTAAGATAAVLVLATTVSTWQAVRATGEKRRADREATRANLEAANALAEAKKQYELNQLFTRLVITTNARAIERRYYGKGERDIALALENLAAVLVAQGRLPEAERAWRDILAIHRRTEAETWEMAWALTSLTRVLAMECKTADVRAVYPELEARCRELLAERRAEGMRARPSVNTSIFTTVPGAEALLGEALLLGGKYLDAEPHLLSGYAGLEELAPTMGAPYAGECIVKLYEAWGKPEQASAWRAKLPITLPATRPAATTSD